MSGQPHDLKFSEPLSEPVAQTGPPKIMERAFLDGSQSPYPVEVVAEVVQGSPSVFDGPLARLAAFLDVFIPRGRDEDIGAAFRLGCLMFGQHSYQIAGQWQGSPVCILDMPLPCFLTVFLRRDIDGHTGEVDIPPSQIQEFSPPQGRNQTRQNEKLPFDRQALPLILPCGSAKSMALMIFVNANLPLGNLRLLEPAKGMPVQLSPIFGKLEHSFQMPDLLCDRGGRTLVVEAVPDEPFAVLIPHVLNVDVTNAVDEIVHRSLCLSEGTLSNLSLRPPQAVFKEVGYLSFSRTGAELLFQVFADRYERSSLLLTSNLPFSEWGQVFQGERMTAALLDRLTHHCHIFELTGESYRFRESVKKSKSAKQ